jgi:hypothetical protein
LFPTPAQIRFVPSSLVLCQCRPWLKVFRVDFDPFRKTATEPVSSRQRPTHDGWVMPVVPLFNEKRSEMSPGFGDVLTDSLPIRMLTHDSGSAKQAEIRAESPEDS